LIADSLEELLDGSRVTNEGGAHLQSTRWDGAKGCLDVVWNPFNKVGRVLALDIQHLILNFLHADLSSEESSASEISSVAEIGGSHHVLGIEHLLGEFWNGDGTESVRATGCERSESNHEEMETWEWNHVDGKFSQVGVQLTWETQASGDTGHDSGDQVVEITIRWGGELEGTHADIVQSFVVDTEGLIRVFD
jgi:hypothetical protein